MKVRIKKPLYWLHKTRLRHPIIFGIFNCLIVVVILYLIMIICDFLIRKSTFDINEKLNSSGVIAILASLLGATVGGIISYFINTRSLIQSNHIRSAVINKKTIYEPLLIELKNLMKELGEEDIIFLSTTPDNRYSGTTEFEVWIRIKNDSRFYQLPEYLKNDLIDFEKKILRYSDSINNLNTNAFNYFKAQLESLGYYISKNESGIKSFFREEDLIQRKSDILMNNIFKDKIVGLPDIKDEDMENLNHLFNTYLITTTDISELKDTKQKIMKSLSMLIKCIELIIITITNKYERRSNLY